MEVKAGYKKTEVGVIPEDWQLRPMLSAVRVATGQVDPKIEPYRSMTLVAPDHIESSSGRLLKKETARDQRAISGKYLFVKGDIVYSKIRPYLRKAILADFDGLCSADMYPLKPASDVSAGFILAAILGHHFSRYAESVSVRSGMPKINRAELAEYTISLPPTKAEQETIAEALSDADALIESLEQLLAKKHQTKQGAMQELLTGKKRLPGFESKPGYKHTEVGVIPEDWTVKPLGLFCEISAGRDLVKLDFSSIPDYKHEFPIYSNALTNGGLYGYSKSYQYGPDKITVTARGDVGHAVYRDTPFCAIGRLLVLSSTYPCDLRFVTEFINQFVDFALESTGVPQLTAPQISKYTVALPTTKAEQTAIASILSDMDAEIAALEAKLAKARLLKQSMMQELLTGRIRLV